MGCFVSYKRSRHEAHVALDTAEQLSPFPHNVGSQTRNSHTFFANRRMTGTVDHDHPRVAFGRDGELSTFASPSGALAWDSLDLPTPCLMC